MHSLVMKKANLVFFTFSQEDTHGQEDTELTFSKQSETER